MNEKFTKDPRNFLSSPYRDKQNKYGYNLARLYDSEVPYRKKSLGLAWIPGANGTIATVKKTMARNDVLYTEQTIIRTGELFNQQIIKASKVSSLMGKAPIKGRTELLLKSTFHSLAKKPYINVKRYGSYENVQIAHFSLVETEQKGVKLRTIEPIPLQVYVKTKNNAENRSILYTQYLRDVLKTDSVRIVIQMIPFNSQFVIDNYRCRIRGKTGDSYRFESHIQPCFSFNKERMIAQIIGCSNITTITEYNDFSQDEKNHTDHLCEERLNGVNIKETAQYMLNRFKEGPWKFSPQLHNLAKKLEGKIDIIDEKSTFEKCFCLKQLLLTMSSHMQLVDLRCFGLIKSAGIRDLAKKLNANKEYYLVTQSPSGFFENKINLWEV